MSIAELHRVVTPTVSRIDLAHGALGGGTVVSVKGSGFAEGAKVFFGGMPSPSVTITSASTLLAESPPGAAEEPVPVQVENEVARSEGPLPLFTYTNRPAVAHVSPNIGSEACGTAVTITGTDFRPGATVRFGGAPATGVAVTSEGSITATTPPGHGVADVIVTSEGESISGQADEFSYVDGTATPLSGLFLAGYWRRHLVPRHHA